MSSDVQKKRKELEVRDPRTAFRPSFVIPKKNASATSNGRSGSASQSNRNILLNSGSVSLVLYGVLLHLPKHLFFSST